VILKHVGFGLSVVAIACFVPGIILPMFVLNMDMAIGLSGAGFNSTIVNKELSILTTISELWNEERYLVSFLIFAFSILIPIVKTAVVATIYFVKNNALQLKLSNAVTIVGKWSMADVFVVAVFLAILSTNHSQSQESHELAFFGMKIAFDVSTQTLSNVGQGFYFFVAYCVLSLLGSQLMLRSVRQAPITCNNAVSDIPNN
jgi:uncharacterized paraquat-inducible protein A